ncbi:MAG: BamA/TamA family outer membrane protein [Myxococcales bacterium]|nr:BamA/TamA family outer membrane protein [Myxococcales bacterium]
MIPLPTTRRSALALTSLAALLLSACAAGPDIKEVIGADYEIDDIEFEGVERFDEDDLLEFLVMGETSWLPFTETYYFNPAFVPADSKRIVDLYRAYGYYDAEVIDVKTRPDDDEIDITFVISEGSPVIIESIDFDWKGDIDVGDVPPEERPERVDEDKREVEALNVLAVEGPMEIAKLNQSVNDMDLALRERGHALAKVRERVEIDRENKLARVRYTLEPGPVVTIERISYEGLGYAPRDLVEREVDYAEGSRYSPSLVKRIEGSIYAMDVFRTVVALPDDEVGPDRRIDIKVRADNSPTQTLKLGFGLGFDPIRWEQRITGRYTHRNLFGRLTRLDLDTLAGYAELPTPFDPEEHGPIARFAPTFRKKGLLEKRLVWTLAPELELGIEQGYQFWSVENRVGVSRFFLGFIEATFSHNLRRVDFFGFGTGCVLPPDEDVEIDPDDPADPNISDECIRNAAAGFFDLGDDADLDSLPPDIIFKDPYLVSYLEAELKLHFTDRIVDPDDGVVLGATYDYAGGFVGGDFDFHKITPFVRAYWTPLERLQFAARVEAGMIFPFGDDSAAPIDLRYYLGGANTVRGWGLRRLSPRSIQDCGDAPDYSCGGIPIGGLSMILANAEVRWQAFGPIILATFLDAGDVRLEEATWKLDELYYSSGLGVRVDSPVGLIRADVGIRLNDPPRFGTESRWAIHLGLGDSF